MIYPKNFNSKLSRLARCVKPLQICDAFSIHGRNPHLNRISNQGVVKEFRRADEGLSRVFEDHAIIVWKIMSNKKIKKLRF